MIKAALGGGGRGIRPVYHMDEIDVLVLSMKR